MASIGLVTQQQHFSELTSVHVAIKEIIITASPGLIVTTKQQM